MQRKTWAVALVVAALMGVPAQAREISWTPYAYELRSGETIAAQLGVLDVQARRDNAGSDTISLRFVRIPAAQPGRGAPILYLAGGPGGSGVEAGRGDRWALFDALRQEGDVILLDQRGTGLSDAPPECSQAWSLPYDAVTTESTLNASLEAAIVSCAAEWRAAGIDLDAYNVAESAADVADLARALGGSVRLVGISYGTFLGFAVLRDHGALVERAVFAGTEGPDHTLKLPTQADDVLRRFSAHVASDPAGAALTPDLRRSVETVFARLRASPAQVALNDGQSLTISLYDAQAVTAFLLASSNNSVRLPALYAAMERGDFSGMAQMVLFMRRFLAHLPAMGLATDASSPVSPQRQRRAGRLARRSVFENAVNAPSANFRSALDVTALPERWHAPLRTNVPGYFISGDLDSRTPPENAEEVRRGFRTSAHLVLEGAGHDNDLFLSSPLIAERIRAFLRGEAMRDERIEVDALRFE